MFSLPLERAKPAGPRPTPAARPGRRLLGAFAVAGALSLGAAGPAAAAGAGPFPIGLLPSLPVGTTPTIPPLPTTPALPTTPQPSTPAVPTPEATTPTFTAESVKTAADGQIIVQFKHEASLATRDALIAQAGTTRHSRLPLDDVELLDVAGSTNAAIAFFESRPASVVWAEHNDVFGIQELTPIDYTTPTDPLYPQQWGLANFGNDFGVNDADGDFVDAWSITVGEGVKVGVVDTGVDASHPDLAGKILPGTSVLGDGRPATTDDAGHGTHVAGIITADLNTVGGVGASPESEIVPLRALDTFGTGTAAGIATAFVEAGQRDLRIVNASFGSTSPSKTLRAAIAKYPNTLFVVAAGNDGIDLDATAAGMYPCKYDLPNVLCVGASNNRDQPASFSNRGTTSVDLYAPGVDIISTVSGNRYVVRSGTSAATPYVTSAAALVASVHPEWSALQVKEKILDSVDHPMSLWPMSKTGGRVNAARAVDLYVGSDGMPPPKTVGVKGSSPGVGSVMLSWDPSPVDDLAVYQVEWLNHGVWVDRAVVRLPEVMLEGLAPGVARTFRIRAICDAGDEGEASDPITIVPRTTNDGPPAVVPTVADEPVETTPPAVRQSVKAPTVSAVKRATSRGQLKGLTFKLSVAGTVTITASPRGGTGKQARALKAITKRFKLKAGTQTIAVGRKASGLKLPKGRWKIVIATASSKQSISVVVR